MDTEITEETDKLLFGNKMYSRKPPFIFILLQLRQYGAQSTETTNLNRGNISCSYCAMEAELEKNSRNLQLTGLEVLELCKSLCKHD